MRNLAIVPLHIIRYASFSHRSFNMANRLYTIFSMKISIPNAFNEVVYACAREEKVELTKLGHTLNVYMQDNVLYNSINIILVLGFFFN